MAILYNGQQSIQNVNLVKQNEWPVYYQCTSCSSTKCQIQYQSTKTIWSIVSSGNFGQYFNISCQMFDFKTKQIYIKNRMKLLLKIDPKNVEARRSKWKLGQKLHTSYSLTRVTVSSRSFKRDTCQTEETYWYITQLRYTFSCKKHNEMQVRSRSFWAKNCFRNFLVFAIFLHIFSENWFSQQENLGRT